MDTSKWSMWIVPWSDATRLCTWLMTRPCFGEPDFQTIKIRSISCHPTHSLKKHHRSKILKGFSAFLSGTPKVWFRNSGGIFLIWRMGNILENQHGTSKSPVWKGTSSSEPPCLDSMLIFQGVSHSGVYFFSHPKKWDKQIQAILLMEEIMHHLGCIKPKKYWDKLPINWCRISSINSSPPAKMFTAMWRKICFPRVTRFESMFRLSLLLRYGLSFPEDKLLKLF